MAPVNGGRRGSLGSSKSNLRGSCSNSQDHWNSRKRYDGGFKRGIRQGGATKIWDKSKEEKGGQNQFLGRDNWFAKQGQQWGTNEDQSFNEDRIKSQPESGWSPENGAVGEGQVGKDSGWDCRTEMAATNGWEASNGKHINNEAGNFWSNAIDKPANGGGEFSKLHGSCSKSQDHWNSGTRSDGGFKWGIRQDGGTKLYDRSKQEKGGQNQFFERDKQFAKLGQQWGTFKDEDLMKSQSESGWSPENGDVEGQAAKDSGWDCPTEMAVTNGWDSSNGKHIVNEPGSLWGNARDEPANGGHEFSKSRGSCSKSQDHWNSRTRFEGGFKQGIRPDGTAKMCDKSTEKCGQNEFFGRNNQFAKQGQQWGTFKDKSLNGDAMKSQPESGWSPENGAAGEGQAAEDSGWDCPTEMAATNGWESSNGKHIINERGNLWGNATDEPANVGGELSKLHGSCRKSQDHWNSGTRFGGLNQGIRRDGGTNMHDKSKQGKGGQNQISERDNQFAKRGQQWGTFKDESLNGDPMKSQPESGWSPENGAAEGQAEKGSGWDCPIQMAATNGWESSNGKDVSDDWNRPVRNNDSGYSRREKGWGMQKYENCGWNAMKLQGESSLPLANDGAGSRRRGQAWDTVKDKSLGRDARKLQSETGQPIENGVIELQKTEDNGWDILPQMAAVDDWGCSKNKSAVCELVSTWKNGTDKHASSRLSLGSELSAPAKWQESWNPDTKVGKGFYASRRDPGAFNSDQSQEKDEQYQSFGRYGGFRSRDQGLSMQKGETRSGDPMRSQLERGWSHVNINGPSRSGQGWSTPKETNVGGGPVEFQPDSGWGPCNNYGTEVHVAKDSGWDSPPDTTEVNGWDLISKKKVVNDSASRWSNATNDTEVQTAKSSGWDSPSEMTGINQFSTKEKNNANERGNPWINITDLQTKDSVSESPSETGSIGTNLNEEKSVMNGSGSPSSNPPNGSELQAAMAPMSECISTKKKNGDNDLGSNATETQTKTSEWHSLSEMGTVNEEDLKTEKNVNKFGSSISNAINDTEVQMSDINGWDFPSEMVANGRDLGNKKNVVNKLEDTWSKATHEPNKNKW